MKKLFTIFSGIFLSAIAFAQAPQKMTYQAVVRNNSNILITNTAVGMRISILQGTLAVYVETQTPTTNVNGLVTIEIGTGAVVSGTFSAINWGSGTYFVKTETDPTGGVAYSITGISQLNSVPYALFSASSGSLTDTTHVSFSASVNTIQAVPNGQTVKVKFNGVNYQFGGANFNTVTNRFTAPIKGVYHFDASVTYGDGNDQYSVFFKKNGSTNYGNRIFYGNSIAVWTINSSIDIYLQVGDYVEFYLTDGLGGFGANIDPFYSSSHWFNGHLIHKVN